MTLHDQNCGMKAYRRSAMQALVVFGQYHRYIPLQAHLAGFKVTEVPIKNSSRKYGTSKFQTFRYQGLFDLLSLLFTYKYSLNPLHFFGVASAVILIPSTLVLMYFVLSQLAYLAGINPDLKVMNRPLLTVSSTVFLFGIFIFFTGFICDFILHHAIRGRIDDILALMTESSGDAKEKPRE